MENNTAVQDFEYVELSNLISKVGDLKAEGYMPGYTLPEHS